MPLQNFFSLRTDFWLLAIKQWKYILNDCLGGVKTENKNEKPAFYGTQNRGIRVTCLQRKRGTVNYLFCLAKVFVYKGLVQTIFPIFLNWLLRKLTFVTATVGFGLPVLFISQVTLMSAVILSAWTITNITYPVDSRCCKCCPSLCPYSWEPQCKVNIDTLVFCFGNGRLKILNTFYYSRRLNNFQRNYKVLVQFHSMSLY
jgi:hypothetical protein